MADLDFPRECVSREDRRDLMSPPPPQNDVHLTMSDWAETWWGGVVEGADHDGEVRFGIRCLV